METKNHPLYDVFESAVAQVATGKGQERHGLGDEFFNQKWVRLAKIHGIGFLSGQAQKKLEEAMDYYNKCPPEDFEVAWWNKEMLGAINYISMCLLYKENYDTRHNPPTV